MLPSGLLGLLLFLCYRHAVMTVVSSSWVSPWGAKNLLEEGERLLACWGEVPAAEEPSAVGGSIFPAPRARSVLQCQCCLCLRKAPACTEHSSGQACGEHVLEVGFESLTEPVSPARAICSSFWKKCHLAVYCAQTHTLRAWESLLKLLYLTKVVEPCWACIGAALACLVTQQDHAGYSLLHLCWTDCARDLQGFNRNASDAIASLAGGFKSDRLREWGRRGGGRHRAGIWQGEGRAVLMSFYVLWADDVPASD